MITLSDTNASTDQKHWFIESDTGQFSIGTTSDALVTNASYRALSINASGNVGIGTTGPWDPLSVIGDISLTGGDLRLGTGSATTTLTVSSTAFAITANATTTLGATGLAIDTDKFVVQQTSGNVGIGTTSPWAKFSINNSTGDTAGQPLFAVASSTATATTTAFIITNSGNVGIGTASPNRQLSVYKSNAAAYLELFGDGTNDTQWVIGAENSDFGSAGNDRFVIYDDVDDSYRLTIDSSGYVGILAAAGSAQHPLDVAGSVSGNWVAQFENTHATAGYGVNILAGDSDSEEALRIEDVNGTDLFQVWGAGKTYIKGNTGIGTTSPYAKLSVVGEAVASHFTATTTATSTFPHALFTQATTTNFAITSLLSSLLATDASGNVIATTTLGVNFIPDNFLRNDQDDTTTGSLTATRFVGSSASATSTFAGGLAVETSGLVYDYSTNRVGIGTASPSTPLDILADGAGSGFKVLGSAGNLLVQAGGGNGSALLSQSNSSTNGFVIGTDSGGTAAGQFLRLQTAGTERLTINNSGNVGIGTTTPTSLLQVAGATAPKITLSDTDASAIKNIGLLSPTPVPFLSARPPTRLQPTRATAHFQSTRAEMWGWER
ncbi:hypothetical protein A2765_03800 [Candidatus Kaiserbacteria bacterium RIFCSPHIGHO2_01_FULL_56_24]|uniref:Uncharacterized protein n=1 Tax=Candidatus Kaiserbacteria bacterium RIFCSPHIGHO2_01_FULL_56_24 TaxID=1798487 RepID=A0A1F6DGV9_9BACT|nr:MAG: hypothetical protein A2765_03800 [Candidatus Kaiserbacteria bacterium RIFCSPHIGHO2_01_FULL_56_24]